MKKEINISYEVLESYKDLSPADMELLEAARKETVNAWAPYSNFRVGAAARLVSGDIVKGTNQENASFPAGICAERVLMSTAASLFPGVGLDTMAISYDNRGGSSSRPISPCGICRQTMMEFQARTHCPMRLILGGLTGEVYVLNSAQDLLPLVFSADDMK